MMEEKIRSAWAKLKMEVSYQEGRFTLYTGRRNGGDSARELRLSIIH